MTKERWLAWERIPPALPVVSVMTLAIITALTSLSSAQAADQPVSKNMTYRVQRGDTLLGLSRSKLDTPGRWRDVQRLNHIRNPRHLRPGSTLRLLPGWLKPVAVQASLVTVSNQVKLDGQPARSGSTLPEGSTIQTGPDSAAVITLPDGTHLRIPSATEVRLERLRAYHGERDLDAGFLLRHGSIEPDSPGKRSRPLNIRTPSGNAAVRGTHFRVHAADGRSTVEVLRGKVATGNRQASTDVPAGQGAWFTATRRPVVAPLPPAPDLGELQSKSYTQTAPRLSLPPLGRGTASYHIEVATCPDFSTMLLDTEVHEPVFVLNSRQDGPHYLRISQLSRSGIEGYGATATIDIAARPPAPRMLPLPATIRAGQPVSFQWQDAALTGHAYRLQIASGAAFAHIIQEAHSSQRAMTLQPVAAQPLTRWWRIATLENGHQGPWSNAQPFTLLVGAPIVEARPRPVVRSGDGKPVHTGSGEDVLLLRAH
ncbi:MAG: FecR domain-containing protein [Lautropia sp.]|nr:FecR domain-containing protein [Lautropia sp.]